MFRVKKIKFTDQMKKVRCEYEKKNSKGSWDEFSILSSDEPEPELMQSFVALREDVLKICEIEDELDRIIVTGVSFSYSGENDSMGATIIARKKLLKANAPLNLITPHLKDDDEADPLQQLDLDTVKRLRTVESSALRFIDGKRAQQSIFDYQTTEKEEVKQPEKEMVAA